MSNLVMGSNGPRVRELQETLNRIVPNQAPLDADGRFGPKTKARVQFVQNANGLKPDGIVGPLTFELISELLRKLGLLPGPPATGAVRVITDQILGPFPSTDNLIRQVIPAKALIDIARFRANKAGAPLAFRTAPLTEARLAIFACRKDDKERAVILALPRGSTPDRVVIHISQGFAQAAAALKPLGWSNPLSPPFVQFALLKHVVNRYSPQCLASSKNVALMYILRAESPNELGPFARDGAFVLQVLTEMAALTNGSFSFGKVTVFTYSSGVDECNVFLASVAGQLNVDAVYAIDPAKATAISLPKGATRRQFLSGQTGGPRPGFDFLPLPSWTNEQVFPQHRTMGVFNYLHNLVMPGYTLHLALETS